ncbi:MAG: methylated-DNA--[protein]-cysteine S-methyltransferase [Elusimicrobiota bacterium]|jgi:methylated-DNA-[protein]-cysteine S-methyltransferase|nr:methylated-DNA--[protein]-cysteine S-methyltransferase [Elusimicrobiota bacterium]
MRRKKIYFYNTIIGELGIAEQNERITNIYFQNNLNRKNFLTQNNLKLNETDIIRKAISEIYDYFDGKLSQFSVKIEPNGTEFMKKVWNKLMEIPYGETRSYKDIATMIGNEKAARAVGLANNKNPIPIIIPCHRVIGTNKKLIGYAGGLDIKRKLLTLENNFKSFFSFIENKNRIK